MTAYLLSMALALTMQASAGPAASPVGEGAQRLVVPALRRAQSTWKQDACLSALTVHLNHFVDVLAPGSMKRLFLDSFHFEFYSAGAPERIILSIKEFRNPAEDPSSGEFSENRRDQGGPAACLTELTVDSGAALELARKYGLTVSIPKDPPEKNDEHYEYNLQLYRSTLKGKARTAWTIGSSRHRGTTLIRTEGILDIDAATGALIGWDPKYRPRKR